MVQIRQATVEDAAAIQVIYAYYVENTSISFEETPPAVGEVVNRIETTLSAYPYLVAVKDEKLLGFAYASQHRTRAAYRTSVDVAVYIDLDSVRCGIGRALYEVLIPMTAKLGYHAAFAGITLPNEASVGMHVSMGFEPVGIYREVGRKFDTWLDVSWWQRLL